LDRAHLVTSVIFLPSILALLKPTHQVTLLRAYFAAALGYFVTQGGWVLDIEGFFAHTFVDPKHPIEPTKNPWDAIFSNTVSNKDEHHIKAERSLAHAETLYGSRPKGWFKDTELKGAERIDGTLFVRAGWLLMEAEPWTPPPLLSEQWAQRIEDGPAEGTSESKG
jgi:hypothetical protein